jgi:large subunit ribosomal protein L33
MSADRTSPSFASGARTTVAMACKECQARNYRTTRKPTLAGPLELKKFCSNCKRHTVHGETK